MDKELDAMADTVEETILIIEAENTLRCILEDLRQAKGRDSVVIKETNYIIKE
jgi:hypothetical protein